jgi:hypothetical protein
VNPALVTALLLVAGPPAKAPPPLTDEDAAVVEHLELLQKLDMLEDLHVVDTAGDDDPKASAEPNEPK